MAFLSKIQHLLLYKNPLGILCNKIFKNYGTFKIGDYTILISDSHSDSAICYEIFKDKIYDDVIHLIQQTSKPSEKIKYLNIGAHIGLFDIYISKTLNRNVQGIAVEFNPLTYGRLLQNVVNNNLEVKCVNAAISDKNEKINVALNESGSSQRVNASNQSETALFNYQSVSSILLNELYLSDENEPIDLLKFDAEGAEFIVFKDFSNLHLKRFKHILIEFHPQYNSDQLDIDTIIENIKIKGEFNTIKIDKINDDSTFLAFFSK